MPRPPPVKSLEPKVFFANERTYVSWLKIAINLGAIAATLVGFGGAVATTSVSAALKARAAEHGAGGPSATDDKAAAKVAASALGNLYFTFFVSVVLLATAVVVAGYAMCALLVVPRVSNAQGGRLTSEANTHKQHPDLFYYRTTILRLDEDAPNARNTAALMQDMGSLKSGPFVVGSVVAVGMLAIFVAGVWQLATCAEFIAGQAHNHRHPNQDNSSEIASHGLGVVSEALVRWAS